MVEIHMPTAGMGITFFIIVIIIGIAVYTLKRHCCRRALQHHRYDTQLSMINPTTPRTPSLPNTPFQIVFNTTEDNVRGFPFIQKERYIAETPNTTGKPGLQPEPDSPYTRPSAMRIIQE